MPGRLSIYDDITFKKDISSIFGIFQDDIQVLFKRYNIAPTINIPIFTNHKIYTYAHFGLIPSWAKDRSNININARSETVFVKNSFRESYKQRRCIIPVNAYFEWEKDSLTKLSTPYLISSEVENYFAFAGIYEYWFDNKIGKTILTCALLTTEPNEKIETVHDRMPVILEKKDWSRWLDLNSSYAQLKELYNPFESNKINIIEVNDLVNNVQNNSIKCIEPSQKIKLIQDTLF